MSKIEFTRAEINHISRKLQDYCATELDSELGQFDAEFLMEFISRELGAYFYNRGLRDAQALFEGRMADVADAIYDIEQPTDLLR